MVLTLRADFLGHTLEHPGLAQALQGRNLLIGRMTRPQLRQAIEGPVAGHVTFEAGLVERILDDVGTEPGNLPLLEFALTLLWEQQVDRLLTHAAYEALGGVDGALARYAEQVYESELAGPEQEQARRLLVQLVRPGEATDHTRRVARRSELDEARWFVAQQLATTRLVVTGRDESGDETVEIVHEALIAGWDRLREWIEADRAFRVWQERLRGALAEWERTGHDTGMLLRGTALAEAERWLEQRPNDISSAERSFIDASRTHQHRGVRRLRAAAAVLATLLALTLGFGAFALVQRNRADAQGRRATSLYLLAGSESQPPHLASLLSLAAHRLWPDAGTRAGLLAQLDRRRDASALLTGHTGELRAIAYSPDGRTLASVSADNTIRLWDPSRRTPARVLSGHPGGVSSAVFSPDGRTLASGGGQDTRIVLWDVASQAQVTALTGPPGGTRALAFSPDGRTLAVAGGEDTIGVLDIASRRPPTVIGRIPGANQVAYSPDGRTLAAAGEKDARIMRWRLPARAPLPALRGHVDGVQAIAFSPDGRTLVSAGIPGDDTIRLWDLGPRPQRHLLTNQMTTRALAFSPDGQTLATGGDYDRLVVLWKVATRTRERALTEHTDTVTALAFSPDGHTLASGSVDRTVALFDLTTPAFVGHTQFITRVSFSRDGRLLASASQDRRVIVWDVARRTPIRILTGHRARVTDVAFSSDSRLLASTSFDGKVLVWRLDQPGPPTAVRHPAGVYRLAFSPVGRILALPGVNGSIALQDLDRGTSRILTGHDGPVSHVAFSPDGATLASAGEDGTVVLHDLARGTQFPLTGHDSAVTGVAFSPDGATLASAGGGALLWNVARRKAVATLGPGISVAFSPDGRTLAVGTRAEPPDNNSTVVLYDLHGRTPYATLERGISAVFSPDGRTLATAGQEIVFRNLDPTSWQARLCQLIGRELTRAEWTEHVPGRSYQTVCR